MLASSKKILDPNEHEHFYFKNDECASDKAWRKFEQEEAGDDEEEPCDCGCQEATEEEEWEHQRQGMEMQWAVMAVVNRMQRAFFAEDEVQNVSGKKGFLLSRTIVPKNNEICLTRKWRIDSDFSGG